MSDELLVPMSVEIPTTSMNDITMTKTNLPNSKTLTIIGWIFTILLTLLLMMSAYFKLAQPEFFVKEFTEKYSYPLSMAMPIGLVELLCALLYLFPRTNILGAILLTGYMGGAIATHVRINDPFIAQVIIALVIWLGPFLREPRLRQILYWRS